MARKVVTLLAVLLALAGAACVLPVGPQFSDPPAVPNYPPRIVTSDPFLGTEIAVPSTPGASATITLTVADANGDALYVHWVSDYPPYTPATRLLPAQAQYPAALPPQTTTSATLMYTVNCQSFAAGPDHRIVVIVSDRPWDDSAEAMNSDYRYSIVKDNATSPVVAGWNVTGCP